MGWKSVNVCGSLNCTVPTYVQHILIILILLLKLGGGDVRMNVDSLTYFAVTPANKN